MKNKFSFGIFLIIIILMLSTAVSADQIELQNGQSLRGEVQNDNLKLKTPYAELNVQSQFLNKINSEDENFVLRASENNRFSGKLLTDIRFLVNGEERVFAAAEITSIDFSTSDSFSDNKQVSLTLRNGDFFFANTVENSISINTSLGSPLNISYENIISIEYLSEEEIYLIKRENASDIKSDLNSQKIIVWPAAGEIVELKFNYLKKITFE